MANDPKKKLTILNEEPDDLDHHQRRLELAHVHGIKTNPIWNSENRYSFTYFLLPPSPLNDSIKGNCPEFVNFLHELCDYHKERRFLASYMAATSFMGDARDGRSPVMNRFAAVVATRLLWWFRRIFIESQYEPFIYIYVNNFFEAFINCVYDRFQTLFGNLLDDVTKKFLKSCTVRDRKLTKDVARKYADTKAGLLGQATFKSLFTMYSIWKFLDENGKIRYLSKLWISVPHWRVEDRSYLLAAIRTMGKSCEGTYVGDLLKEVGMQLFKVCLFFILAI